MIKEYRLCSSPVVHDGRVVDPLSSDLLYLKGALIPVFIEHPEYIKQELKEQGLSYEPVQCNALIDTGAFLTIAIPSIIDRLKLIHTGFKTVHGVTGTDEKPVYSGAVRTELGVLYEIPIVSCDLNHSGLECIIGRNILRHLEIKYYGTEGRFSIDDLDRKPLPSLIDQFEILRELFRTGG